MKIVIRKTRVSRDGSITSISDVPVVLLSLLILISEVPILLRNTPNAVFYGLVILFFALTINCYLRLDAGKRNTMYLVLLYFGMISLYKILGISSAAFSYYSTTVKFFFFLVVMIGIFDHLSTGQKKYLLYVTILSILYTVLQNVQLYMRYGASRFASLFLHERFTTNAVNTAYVTALLIFSGILFVVFLHQRKGLIKFTALLLSILCFVFNTVIAQRMIILALSVLMYPLLVLFNARRSRGGMVGSIVILLVLFLVLLNYNYVLDLLERIIRSRRLAIRIHQLHNYIETGDLEETGGSLAARSRLMWLSVQSWFSSVLNFFFGVGDHHGNDSIIGNHSHILDEMARYGFFGAFIWIGLLRSYLKQIISCAGVRGNARLQQQLHVLFFVILLRAMIGALQEVTIGVQMFIVIPIVFSLLSEREAVSSGAGSLNS